MTEFLLDVLEANERRRAHRYAIDDVIEECMTGRDLAVSFGALAPWLERYQAAQDDPTGLDDLADAIEVSDSLGLVNPCRAFTDRLKLEHASRIGDTWTATRLARRVELRGC